MKTFNLTEGELKVAFILVESCLKGMGGKRPSDLNADPFTWIWLYDLTEAGYSRHQAAGYFSSLEAKGFITLDGKDSAVTEEGYQWLDTVWDLR